MESELKKGPWTPEEDETLRAYIQRHGIGSWRSLPAKAGLSRCGKSCRLRWSNYLRPGIKRGSFSQVEDENIIRLHALLGNRWSMIARHLPKRTDNEIKNYWNTHLKKRLANNGIDPVTHKPRSSDDVPGCGGSHHTAQWESARLEAEAREASQLRLRAHAASASASVPPPPRMPPRPAYGGGAPALTLILEAHGAAAPAMQLQPIMPAYEEAALHKDDQLRRQRWGDQVVDVADADNAAAAFAGMLLDESLHQEQTEVAKKYWVFIMNLVISPSSSSIADISAADRCPRAIEA